MENQIYEVDYNGTIYEVEAPSMEAAQAAFAQAQAPQQPAAPQQAPATAQGGPRRGAGITAPGMDIDGLKGLGTGLLGAADVATTIVSGGLATPIAGIMGAAVGGAKNDSEVANAVYDQVQSALTWSPKTEAGQQFFTAMGDVLDPVMTRVRDVFAGLDKANVPPAVSAALETLVFGAPEILAGQKLGIGVAARRRLGPLLERRMQQSADRLGIDLNNNTVRPTTINAAEGLTGGARGRGETGIEDIVPLVKKAEAEAKKNVNELYKDARSTSAVVQYKPIADATDAAFAKIRELGVDIEASPDLKARIKDLLELDERIPGVPGAAGKRPGTSGTPASTVLGPDGKPLVPATGGAKAADIPLNDVELINQRITRSIAKVGKNTPEGLGLIELRRHVNNMIDDQFAKDMISGDPTARAKWNEAKAANHAYKQRFHSDKVIGRIVKDELTADEVARLILGASETKHTLGAVRTVRKLKKILGDDAPELDAIRTSVMVDMFAPMFKDTPNWKGAVERIRLIQRNSGPLLRELGISENDMDIMRRAAVAAGKAVEQSDLDMRGFIAASIGRLTVGHDIAKAAVHVKLVNMFADRVLGVGQKTHKQLLREFTGDELASNPLIANSHPSKRALLANAAIIAELQAAGENPEDR